MIFYKIHFEKERKQSSNGKYLMLRVYSRILTFNVAVSFLNLMSLSCQRVLRWQSDSCERHLSRRARCAMCTRWSIGCYKACCTRTTQSRASVHVRRICAVCAPPRHAPMELTDFSSGLLYSLFKLTLLSSEHFWTRWPVCSGGKIELFWRKVSWHIKSNFNFCKKEILF